MKKIKENDQIENKTFLPSDLARAAGVNVRTIQKWTNKGLLPERRDDRGWRVYDVESLIQAMELARKIAAS